MNACKTIIFFKKDLIKSDENVPLKNKHKLVRLKACIILLIQISHFLFEFRK